MSVVSRKVCMFILYTVLKACSYTIHIKSKFFIEKVENFLTLSWCVYYFFCFYNNWLLFCICKVLIIHRIIVSFTCKDGFFMMSKCSRLYIYYILKWLVFKVIYQFCVTKIHLQQIFKLKIFANPWIFSEISMQCINFHF
jgi:hypothetical protein